MGSGQFSRVIGGNYNGENVAVKILKNNDDGTSGGFIQSLISELKVLAKTRNGDHDAKGGKYVVQFHGVVIINNYCGELHNMY